MTPYLWWLLECSFVTAVVIPIIAVLCRFFPRRPAVQHALWVIVLLKFLTPPLVVWPWQIHNIVDSASLLIPSWNNSGFTLAEAGSTTFEHVAQPSWFLIAHSWINTGSVSRAIAFVTASLGTIWLVGAAIFALRQYLRVRKQMCLIRRGTAAPPGLSAVVRDAARHLRVRPLPTLIVHGIESPVVWCLGRPTLLWPENMATEGPVSIARSIVAHELAHIRRRDHWIAWIQLVAGVIWWWNPLFWFVQRKLTVTAEMACDAFALSTYPEDRCAYAESLLKFSSTPESGEPAFGLAICGGTPSSFEGRMRLIVSEHVKAKLSVVGILLPALIAMVITPSWTLGSVEGRTQNPSDEALGSESDIVRDSDFAIVNEAGDTQSRLSAVREAVQQHSRARLADAKRSLVQATATQVLASKRVKALEDVKEDELRKPELEEALRILELAESELEYAEAFHDLAERQMNVTK